MSNDHVSEAVAELDDREVLIVIQAVFQRIFSQVSEAQIAAAVEDDVSTLTSLGDDEREFILDSEASLQTARHLLGALASNEELAPLLSQCIDEAQSNDDMLVETVLAFGIVSSVALLVASVEFEIRIGDTVITKHKTDPKLVEAVMAPITKLAEGITRGLS